MLLNRKLKILLGIAIGKYMAKNGIVKIAKRNAEGVHKDEENLKRRTFPGSRLVYQWKENLISINEMLEEIHAHDAIQPSHVTLLLKFVNELTNSAKNFNTVSKEALPIVIAFVETLVPLAHFIVLLDGNSSVLNALLNAIREILYFWFSKRRVVINQFNLGWHCVMEVILAMIRVANNSTILIAMREVINVLDKEIQAKLKESESNVAVGYIMMQTNTIYDAIATCYNTLVVDLD